MKFLLALDSIGNQLLINSNPTIINILIHPVVFPFILRDREAAELLSDFHFNFHITLVVLFELPPLVGGMVGEIASTMLIRFCGFARGTEIAH